MEENFALESFRLLRRHRESLELPGNRWRVPPSYLNFVSRHLDIRWWSVLLYSLHGGLVVSRSGGDRKDRIGQVLSISKDQFPISAEQFMQVLSDRANTAGVLAIEFTDPRRRRDKLAKSFGFLVVQKPGGFDAKQTVLLNEIAQLLGDYIMFRDQLFRLRRLSEGLGHLERVAASSWLFGSMLAHTTYELGKAISATVGGYAVVDRGILRPEFFYRASGAGGKHGVSWRLLQLDRQAPVPPEIATILDAGEPIVVPHDSRNEVPLRLFATSRNTEIKWEHFISLFAPVVFDQQLIGLFVFGVSRFAPCFEEQESLSLLRRAQRLFSRQCIYTFQRRTKELIVSPVFATRETRVEPNLVFVLMPFGEAWSNRIWERLLRPVCAALGMRAVRADDLYGRDIMEDIWGGICRARVVIADITGRNANVFYELGLAHTVGKDVILITQSVTDIPFDLNRFRHIVYEDNMDGYDKLKKELEATITEIINRLPSAT